MTPVAPEGQAPLAQLTAPTMFAIESTQKSHGTTGCQFYCEKLNNKYINDHREKCTITGFQSHMINQLRYKSPNEAIQCPTALDKGIKYENTVKQGIIFEMNPHSLVSY